MLDKKSKVILVVILIVILMVTFGSHFFNFWQAGDLWQYTGSRINRGGDLFGYFSFMEQARQGAWSFFNLYSILPQQPYFVHPLWLVLGKLGAWTGFSNLAIYLLAQALFIVIFVYLWRVFLGKILTSKIVNYVFVLSLVIGGGLFSGAWFYEASNFLILFYSPLFILALSCFLAVLWLALKLIEKKFDWRISLGAGSLSLFLFLNHFYDVVPLVLVLAGLFIFLILNKRELKSYFFFFLIIGMFLLPGAIYYGWIFFTIPGLAEWGSFLQYMRSEPFIFYFVAYGLLLPLAIVGLKNKVGIWRADLYRQFMLTWFLIQGLVVVIFSKQLNAKFLLGFSMPLTIFAVLGVEYTCQKIKDADLRILIKWLLIIFLCLGNVYSVVGNILIYKKPTADFGFVFQPPEVFLATDWAKYNLPRNSIIMANFSAWGNILSGLTGRFSLIGHSGFGMINIKQKNLWVEYFYKDNQDLDNKKELLNFLGVDYVWFGKKEKKLGTFDPGVIDWLELVYRNSAESIYRVK